MKHSTLSLAILLSLGLTACGGGGGGDSASPTPMPAPEPAPAPAPSPAPAPVDACTNINGIQTSVPPGYAASGGVCTLVDACLNYDGDQSLAEISDKGFVRDDSTGICTLERNHVALATTGVDRVRMMGYTGKDIPIAIVDTGYLPDHTEYVANILSVASYSDNYNYELDAGEKVVGDYRTEGVYHGTGVAGQSVGKKAGVATGAGVHLKGIVMNNSSTAIAIKDALLGDSVQISNLSNGFGSGFLMYRNQNNDETGVLATISPTNHVIVFASGNEAFDLSDAFDDAKSRDPSRVSFFDHHDEADNILFVGAFDQQKNTLALYSNFPGHRTSFQDRFIVTGDYIFETASSKGDGEFEWVGGTSLAAPQVSGAIAILMEANPRLTAVQAAHILLDTAKRLPEWGYGKTCTVTTNLGTFNTDCGAMKFGRGLMDLPAALNAAAAR